MIGVACASDCSRRGVNSGTGVRNREIALRLKVKEHSVRNYIYRIFEKLGVSSRVELMLYMFSHRDTSN